MASAMPSTETGAPDRPRKGPPPPELRKHVSHDDRPDVDFLSRGRAIGTLVFVFGVVFVVLLMVYKTQVKELELPQDEKELATVMAAGSGRGVSAKEAVYRTVLNAEKWVTIGRVALSSNLSEDEAEALLRDLIEEGRIKSGRDKQGRRLYRVT